MQVDELAERLEAAISSFPAALRPALLRILNAPSEKRAEEIGRLHQNPWWREVGELLIDLEEEPALRKLVAAEIRGQLRAD
jgi:hypothetical protein